MEKRFILFLLLSFAIIYTFTPRPDPQAPEEANQEEVAQNDENEKADADKDAAKPPADKVDPEDGPKEENPDEPGQTPDPAEPKDPPEEPPAEPAVAVKPAAVPDSPEQWATLGSADPESQYRMLITLTSRGAAVTRIELSSDRFRDIEDRSGYLGHVAMDEFARGVGCPVDVVGPGTPAAEAGLKPEDTILKVDDQEITAAGEDAPGVAQQLRDLLASKKPGDEVTLTVRRGGDVFELQPVALGRRPLEVVRPEADDPLSFRMTPYSIDGTVLTATQQERFLGGSWEILGARTKKDVLAGRLEKDGANGADQSSEDQVVFFRTMPDEGLVVFKTFRLEKVPTDELENDVYPAYHLEMDVEIHNTGDAMHKVAYQLDGPTGLPTEGYWYANKVGRGMGSPGLRDVIVAFDGNTEPKVTPCPDIATDAIADEDDDPEVEGLPWEDQAITYIGVDAQYFSVVMIPKRDDEWVNYFGKGEAEADIWFAESRPICVGAVDEKWKKKANTSYRMISQEYEIEPSESLRQRFTVFAGPKKPELLAHYSLGELVYYGWFGLIAKPLLGLLHFFYGIVGNYGLAIIMLTAVVRLAMFPMSKKQAMNAQMMAKLQPEIKKLQEKYKKNLEERTRKQQELFRKHNYNPLAGCLVMFVQLPIFIGLYRSLMVDVELRQAPLFGSAIRWCSNLSAPDMLWYWKGVIPAFFTDGNAIYVLGPYLNVLPLMTVVLFLMQQKMFMPPPADDQAAMQQKIMKFMMIFIGLLFFKVASGLCLYFIVSSLWGLGERQFMPKIDAGKDTPPEPVVKSEEKSKETQPRSGGTAGGNGAAKRKKRKKNRGRK